MWRLLSLSLLAWTTGCIGAPFVTPPARVSVTYLSLSKPLPRGGTNAAHFEVGVHPAALLSRAHDRQLDAGIGYGFVASKGGFVHAPYLEIQALPLIYALGKTTLVRAGTAMKPLLLFGRTDEGAGFGGTAQLLIELSDHTSGTFSNSSSDGGVIGFGAGELGIGLHLEASAMQLNGTSIWGAGVGVNVRLPASMGFAWVFVPPGK